MFNAFGFLVAPFWSHAFMMFRKDPNVEFGHFRVGALLLETVSSNFLFVAAKITDQVRNPISLQADDLVKELEILLTDYTEGLRCAGEFLNEVAVITEKYHNRAHCSSCNIRNKWCDDYDCPAISTASPEQEKRDDKFIRDYEARK